MADLHCLNALGVGGMPVNLECQLVIILKEQKAEKSSWWG